MTLSPRLLTMLRQFGAFFGVGIGAAIVHYGVMIALVELVQWRAVPGTLAGYVAGGFVSYALNRAYTYQTDRSHQDATWRFVVVAAIGFCLTWGIMHVFVERLAIPYILAQVMTHGIVLFWSFLAHKYWSFRDFT
jgi:putative flippase GtrA